MPHARSSSQLPLDLSHGASIERDDLVESPANAMAIALIDAWPDWPGRLTVLAGPIGSGKSHISSVWLSTAGGVKCQAQDISYNSKRLQECLESGGNILIEDAAPGNFDETALFHLLNSVRQAQASCLITSRSWPMEWGIELPDLLSRLRAAQVVELQEPDDMLLKQVMFKLFADRQLVVDERVVDYCVLRMERSLESAARVVAAIDAEALSLKSAVTRSTAAKALKRLGIN